MARLVSARDGTGCPPSPPWDELRDRDGRARPAAQELLAVIDHLGLDELRARQAAATADIVTLGITFTLSVEVEVRRVGV
jgi:uncharacterized circularly permuted ATP-grasp superfamily protein